MSYFVRQYIGIEAGKRFAIVLDDGREFDVSVAVDKAEIPDLVDLYMRTMDRAPAAPRPEVETVPVAQSGDAL